MLVNVAPVHIYVDVVKGIVILMMIAKVISNAGKEIILKVYQVALKQVATSI